MAGGARRIGPMSIELLADRDGASNIRFESRNTRRGSSVEAEDALP